MKIDLIHKKNRKFSFYLLIYIIIIILLFLISSEIASAEMFGLIWEYKFTGNVTGVSISLGGNYIAVGCKNNKIYYLNNKGKLLWTYNTEFPIKNISVFENGDSIVATGDNNDFFTPEGKFYALNSKGEILQSTKCASINSFSFSEDGKYLAITVPRNLGNCDGIYFYKDGNLLWEHITALGSQGESTVSISSDGNYIAVGMKNPDMFDRKGGIYLLNSTGKIIWKYIISGSYMFKKYLVSISRDGKYIAGGHENSNKLYYLNNFGELLWEYNSSNYVKAISVSKDGKYIAFGNKDNILHLLNYKGQLIWDRKINNISSISISGDGNIIVVGTLDNKVYIFKKYQILAQNAIKDAYDVISVERSKNVKLTEAESLFTQSENAFKKGNYTKAKDLAEQARNKAIKTGKEANDATSSINKANSTISQEKSKKVIIAEAEFLFTQSENVFKKGNYTKAKDLAEQARNKAIKTGKEANDAYLLINKIRTAISKDEYSYIFNKPIETLLESLLSQSGDAYKKGNYWEAYILAKKGYAIAIDVDQDGVPNKEDFIPTIKNTYIYISLNILFINFIIILFYIRRKRVITTKINNYREKLKQWEIEGYNVHKFSERWFK